MRITDSAGKPLHHVYLALSNGEAAELADALAELPTAKAGWHAHISDTEFQREVTVYREDDPTALG